MEISRHWRLRKQRYALVGEVCPHCDAKLFPPRDVCPECGGAQDVGARVGGEVDPARRGRRGRHGKALKREGSGITPGFTATADAREGRLLAWFKGLP